MNDSMIHLLRWSLATYWFIV